jgi:predicted Rossmann-fold nucleotide-binding protein
MPFRVVVCGSRTFTDFPLLCQKLDRLLSRKLAEGSVVILSGGCRGTDALAERYASLRGLPVERFLADWARLGRSAGWYRNELMVKQADAVIAFWDGKSRGTASTISIAKFLKKPLRVVFF